MAAFFKINLRSTTLTVTNTGADSDDSLGPSISRLDLHIRSFVLDHVIIERTLVDSSSFCPELKDVGYY